MAWLRQCGACRPPWPHQTIAVFDFAAAGQAALYTLAVRRPFADVADIGAALDRLPALPAADRSPQRPPPKRPPPGSAGDGPLEEGRYCRGRPFLSLGGFVCNDASCGEPKGSCIIYVVC